MASFCVASWAKENRRYADGLYWNRATRQHIPFFYRINPSIETDEMALVELHAFEILCLMRLYDTFSHAIPFRWLFHFPLLIVDRHWQLHIKQIKSVDSMNATCKRQRNKKKWRRTYHHHHHRPSQVNVIHWNDLVCYGL